MTRIIKNPYPDRTLSLNIFQLIKNFSVQTKISEFRFAFIIQLNSISYDSDFVVRHPDFLRQKLLDPSLIDELPTSLAAAKPAIPSAALKNARIVAVVASLLKDSPSTLRRIVKNAIFSIFRARHKRIFFEYIQSEGLNWRFVTD
jgi:hypothetical protein